VIILKLGGSLLSGATLQQWLSLASAQGKGKVVIVPGGGVFAEQVRLMQDKWHYHDKTAHYMALLAMQQMALLLQDLCSDLMIVQHVTAIRPALLQQRVVIWSPLAVELDAADVPATWDISSDSLAAWLAVQLSAKQLLLIKSAHIAADQSIEHLVKLGVLDGAFMRFVQGQNLVIQCLSSHSLPELSSLLNSVDCEN